MDGGVLQWRWWLYYLILFFAGATLFTGCAGMPLSKSDKSKGLFQLTAKDRARMSQRDSWWESRYKNAHRAAMPVPYGRRPSSEGYIWPLQQGVVTSYFGKRPRSFHDGIDIQNTSGTAIFASKSGQVIYSGQKVRGYGNMVILKHEGSYATVYAHNRKNLVKRGDFVSQGQLIALVGATGHASGPHLHFEIRHLETARDPLDYLPRAPSPAIARK